MKKFFKGRFVQQFLPFIILITGGSFVIREFVGLKYKYPKVTSHDLDVEIKKKGIEMKKPRTLEEEYEIIKVSKLRLKDIKYMKNIIFSMMRKLNYFNLKLCHKFFLLMFEVDCISCYFIRL
ncbi:hypothetical protein E2986_03541 [Frieseomelitta varia]|uniref:Cytochrome c oxidase assembly protein COX16 homolog, mitochondrial n=1 Tax=Frieseomelitta varia TaxID=561572 RepID=A0A833RL88_9HYME|nr:hypothetical protein E2986_03541 [Frieseomelitta varia]